ncbi:PREDICTED: cysteine and histidine-rich protein 1-like [Branchiostoma belcheri]|uniref:Cysteine and histidine-rich protein 1-like n=1 Tax=Branchiostoma belcheri TaxID=7741 RepID=A0A6P4ZHS0_BRABE|nr:PREDICTED: cysteine and histidine-rich protein 1-like [Branchiostoma belcheri]KAI8520113.1 Cysteine and histidine-rich protein 1 [Branchiostoma belcheri]
MADLGGEELPQIEESSEQPSTSREEDVEIAEPVKKRAKKEYGDGKRPEEDRLERRLNGILCCTVCLDLPKSAVYQCTNGHLMCAGCFTHLLADARLKDEQASCPGCRTDISRGNCSRNLAVEKAVSELPANCQYCSCQYPRSKLEKHETEECQDRLTNCKYRRIGCQWRGPFHEHKEHEQDCCHPKKSGADITEALDVIDLKHKEELELFNHIFNLLSFEKIGFADIQLRPYRTDEFITRLYYESPRFTVLNQTWVVKARINNNDREPNLTVHRQISYQIILKSKVNTSIDMNFLVMKGPYDDVKLEAAVKRFQFSSDSLETDYYDFPLVTAAECNKLLAARNINLRIFMFQVQK